jgi:hypothetical protein
VSIHAMDRIVTGFEIAGVGVLGVVSITALG